MAEATTIARPYAEAVFKLADQGGKLAAWSGMLETMAQVAGNPEMYACMGNPKLTGAQLTDLFLSLCRDLDEDGRNFVRVLMENRRLAVLPEIRDMYETLKHEREGVVEAQIYSAFPLDDAQKASLVADLERKLKRRVTATVAVDPELIGGVRAVVGDQVIDASVRGKLAAMETALKS